MLRKAFLVIGACLVLSLHVIAQVAHADVAMPSIVYFADSDSTAMNKPTELGSHERLVCYSYIKENIMSSAFTEDYPQHGQRFRDV